MIDRAAGLNEATGRSSVARNYRETRVNWLDRRTRPILNAFRCNLK